MSIDLGATANYIHLTTVTTVVTTLVFVQKVKDLIMKVVKQPKNKYN